MTLGLFGSWALLDNSSLVDETHTYVLEAGATSDRHAALSVVCVTGAGRLTVAIRSPYIAPAAGLVNVLGRVSGGERMTLPAVAARGAAGWASDAAYGVITDGLRDLINAMLAAEEGSQVGLKIEGDGEWAFPLSGFTAGWKAMTEACGFTPRLG